MHAKDPFGPHLLNLFVSKGLSLSGLVAQASSFELLPFGLENMIAGFEPSICNYVDSIPIVIPCDTAMERCNRVRFVVRTLFSFQPKNAFTEESVKFSRVDEKWMKSFNLALVRLTSGALLGGDPHQRTGLRR